MTSNRLAVAILALSACSTDVPTLEVRGVALQQISLAPPDDQIPTTLGHYRWELVEAPATTMMSSPPDQTASVTVMPPRRGIYGFERWFVGEVAEELSYFVVVTVDGARPIPRLDGPSTSALGDSVGFTGQTSSSPEGLSVSFDWRLATRPEGSTADVSATADPTTTFVPDVAGAYRIELRVSDGELWSEPATVMLVAH